jgi:hypothetical protein
MARLCERPGCSVVAEFRYAFDPEQMTVWLEPLASGGTELAGVLCRRHADAMVVPLGWMLDDRRSQAPQLFRTPGTDTAPRGLDRPRRQRPSIGDAPAEALQLSLEPTDEAAAAPHVVESAVAASAAPVVDGSAEVAFTADPPTEANAGSGCQEEDAEEAVRKPAEPWRPRFDQTDDLGGLLTAQSPLLRRAFGRNPPPKP